MKNLIQAGFIGIAASALFFCLFAAAAILAPQDQRAIRQHLIDSIANGELSAQTSIGPVPTFPVYRSAYDCFILDMMPAPTGSRAVEALSNRMVIASERVPDARVPPYPPCEALLGAFPELGGSGAQFVDYNRYILGMRVLGRVLLSVTSVAPMRRILVATSYALLGLIGLSAFWQFVRAWDDTEKRARAAGYIAIAGSLALFYGVNFFDAMLNFGPLDDVHFVFILLGLLWPMGDMRPAILGVYAGSYGSLIAIFEFLSGGIPLALAFLPLLLVLGYRGEKRGYFVRLVTLWGSFCTAVIATFVIKKIYVIAFLGDSEDFLATLLHRTYGELELGDAQYSLVSFVITYYRASAVIGLGASRVAAVVLFVSLAVIAIMTWRRARSSSGLLVSACWLALFAIGIWYLVFLNHAILHSYFMARLLIVPIIAAAVLIAVEGVTWSAKRNVGRLGRGSHAGGEPRTS